jgi:hypothetical protein
VKVSEIGSGRSEELGHPGSGQASIIQIENFVTDEEADHIVKIGTPGLSQSSGTGAMQADGSFARSHSEYRTSKNSWLMGDLSIDPIVTQVCFLPSRGVLHGLGRSQPA